MSDRGFRIRQAETSEVQEKCGDLVPEIPQHSGLARGQYGALAFGNPIGTREPWRYPQVSATNNYGAGK